MQTKSALLYEPDLQSRFMLGCVCPSWTRWLGNYNKRLCHVCKEAIYQTNEFVISGKVNTIDMYLSCNKEAFTIENASEPNYRENIHLKLWKNSVSDYLTYLYKNSK